METEYTQFTPSSQRPTRRDKTAEVRRVDGSCAKHLAVENYTVVMLLTFVLNINSIPSPTRSFIPGLKPSFSANPSHRSLSFLLQY